MKKAILASVAGVALAFGLAACSNEAEVPVDTAAEAPDAPEGVSVNDGRMNIPAVAGSPAAIYFTLINTGPDELILRAANVAGAQSASLHETADADGVMTMPQLDQLPIAPGETVAFMPGGKHVMVMGLPAGLEPGGEIEVTLSFDSGDKVSFPARLLAPGDPG